jgi:two-component system chemotaxis response regulator CheY
MIKPAASAALDEELSVAKSVLVVDDSATIRGFCKLCLRPLEVDLAEAVEGAAALELARKAPPDLVIVDVNMPGMDGFALLKAMREDADPAVRAVPVLLLTGDRSEGLRERAKASGANELFEKPIKPQALQDVVKRLLSGEAR